MEKRNKIYFASDFHLGLGVKSDPVNREKHVVNWLDSVSDKAEAIYLVGDVFDFWWEYKKVVPRGFTRFLGKISELTDSGIEVHFFTGNHDMWIGDYLNKECGMILHTSPLTIKLKDKLVHIAHGEGLGVKDRGYKILLWIFRNRFLRKLYSALHPGIGIGIAHRWSLNSRLAKNYSKEFLGPENENLFNYAREILATTKVDYFIFGHRHIALDHAIGEDSRLIIMGNWFDAPSYVELQEKGVELLTYPYS